MSDTYYSFAAEGQSHFFRVLADVEEEILEPFFNTDGWKYSREYFETIPAFYQNKQLTALGGLEIVGTVMCFIGTCFAKKIFDDFYEKTLKRPVGAQIDRLMNALSIPDGKTVEYRDVVHLKDIDLVVVVRATMKKDCGEAIQRQIMQAHRIAYDYIKNNGRKAPIHCHRIIDGKIDIEPEFFSSLEEIKKNEQNKTLSVWKKAVSRND
ncbi:hypothetical protein [Uliginosibacterium sediminicola]|uniref:Uncharacterized protein n=1 Tax=Uliginosibacterium sediminicola TaxID=2024550 RepID=A0ABU9YZN8_9RHOO